MSVRALVAVTHLLGAGHLTRAAAIGRALAAAGADVTLVSGGRAMPLIDTAGLDLVQLPPLCTRVGEFTRLRDAHERPVDAAYLARRRRDLLAAFARAAPDIVVTELYPFGRRVLADEFDALLDAAAARGDRRVLVAASVRDILAPPSTPAKTAHTHALLARRYDLVLVHGDKRVAPLAASWPVDAGLAARLVYTGYVDPDPSDATPARDRSASGEIVVSGGSSIAGLPLYRAALAAAARTRDRRWRVLVGAAVPEDAFAALGREAGPNVALERARSDFRHLLRAGRVFVGQAGYNTAMDLLATGIPAVLVPFEQGGETEQRLRAAELERRGLAHVVPEDALSADTLLAGIRQVEASPSRHVGPAIARDGAARSARILLARLHTQAPRAHTLARVDA